MTEYLVNTEETANLVDMGSIVPAIDGDLAAMTQELAERRQEAATAEEEIEALTKSYDDEVADHAETAKRAGAAEEALVDLWELMKEEGLIQEAPESFFNTEDAQKVKLCAVLVAAQGRVKAARDYAAKKAADGGTTI